MAAPLTYSAMPIAKSKTPWEVFANAMPSGHASDPLSSNDPLADAKKALFKAMADEKYKREQELQKMKQRNKSQLTRKPLVQFHTQTQAYAYDSTQDDKEPMDEMAREREELRKKAAAIDRMCNPQPKVSDRPKTGEHWLKVIPCKSGTLERCNICGHTAEPVSAVQNCTNELHYTVRCSNSSCMAHNFHDLTKYPNKDHAIRHWNSVNSMDLKTVKKSLVICGENGYICIECGNTADFNKQLCKKCATQTPF